MKARVLVSSLASAFVTLSFCSTPAAADTCDLNGTDAGVNAPDANGGAFAPPATALACGNTSTASQPLSTAVGANASAAGTQTSAFGANANARADTAPVAFPISSLPPVSIGRSTALGAVAISIGVGSLAVGDQSTVASGVVSGSSIVFTPVNNGTAIGSGALVTADGGTTLGASSRVLGVGATALGSGSAAFADNSVAIGAGSIASEANTISVGATGGERRITNMAAGLNATDAVNLSQLNVVAAVGTANSAAITTLQGRDTAQRTQINDRLAADTALGNRVSALEALASGVSFDLDRIDRRASAGTATAMALGGLAFLPDKRFNLSGSLGFYRGASAGAINLGAMVSPGLALNAGVARGFNRGGRTGARIGFTFGF